MTLRMSLLGLSGALMLLALGMVFLYAPTDIVLGVSQRIFYVHVPLALVGFLAFAVVAVCSVGYLWKGSERMDSVAYAAAEIGVLFTSLMLITGMLWAKPAWGVWWSWSPQLTTSLILWFLYAAYLMLRAYAPPGDTGARYAAVLGIIGFIDVPIVYMAARWWRDLHPQKVLGPACRRLRPRAGHAAHLPRQHPRVRGPLLLPHGGADGPAPAGNTSRTDAVHLWLKRMQPYLRPSSSCSRRWARNTPRRRTFSRSSSSPSP